MRVHLLLSLLLDMFEISMKESQNEKMYSGSLLLRASQLL